jgi:hypothetical protein
VAKNLLAPLSREESMLDPPPWHQEAGVLDRYREALAIVETVSNALQAAEDVRRCPHVGAEVATLRQAVRALILVHEEFDLAIPGGES